MNRKESFFRPQFADENTDGNSDENSEEFMDSGEDTRKMMDNNNMDKSIKDLFPDGIEDAFDDYEQTKNAAESKTDSELSDQELALLCRERICPACPVTEEAEDSTLRTMAELDNMKKRLSKEKEDYLRYSSDKILKDIIPALGNLNLALQHAPQNDEAKDFVLGVEMTKKQLLEALEAHGLKELGNIGEDFDPNIHEAMGMTDIPQVPEGHVCNLLSKGYSLNGRLITPAKVMVCKRG